MFKGFGILCNSKIGSGMSVIAARVKTVNRTKNKEKYTLNHYIRIRKQLHSGKKAITPSKAFSPNDNTFRA